ncbi:protein of unknown function [Pseudorhizobium banfieldiae]|uniref:Uncharacterized protein n=1 Tax=Pseudorhizobium banfieldiae TaxID=1125847 RepID=L0NIE7_9HYPH|nr:hypothetical protein [Pseudorhizobium banfieldiae]CAD6617804.1 hypothetical protein RNT25_03463 [arsenite-oxidising bacterium NT-25]CCF20870.1 protein of unknown function [Pseudorhizobium banfieldiae]
MTARSVIVRFADGRSVDGWSLREELSADVFQRQAHYDLAGAYAQAICTSPGVEPVLHNLLALKSPLIRDVSAALFVFERDPEAVTELQVAPNISAVLRRFRPQMPIVENQSLNAELVSRRAALTTAAKAIAHRLYRMRRRPYVGGKAVVRAWVEVTLKMYAREVKNAQVRVFPFPLNRHRQKEFLDELRRQRIDWTRDGLPYRLSSAAGLIAAGGNDRALAMAKFERDAFVDFASEVVRSGAGPVFTSDEFELGAVAAGQAFRVAGLHYVNSAHGVGFYCPRTAYSHFRYLTASQREFYGRSSPETQFVPRQTANFVLAEPPSPTNGRASVVFVHQDFRGAGLPAEADVEEQIMERLDALKLPAHVSKYVKVHPNANPQHLSGRLRDCSVATEWNHIEFGRCLFLMINSTAFYDLIGAGDIAVFKDVSFSPELYLEGEYQHFDLQTLAPTIEGWVKSHGAARRE